MARIANVSPDVVAQVKAALQTGQWSQAAIAQRFGLHAMTVHRIAVRLRCDGKPVRGAGRSLRIPAERDAAIRADIAAGVLLPAQIARKHHTGYMCVLRRMRAVADGGAPLVRDPVQDSIDADLTSGRYTRDEICARHRVSRKTLAGRIAMLVMEGVALDIPVPPRLAPARERFRALLAETRSLDALAARSGKSVEAVKQMANKMGMRVRDGVVYDVGEAMPPRAPRAVPARAPRPVVQPRRVAVPSIRAAARALPPANPPEPLAPHPVLDTGGRYAALCEFAAQNGMGYTRALQLWHRHRVGVAA